MAQSLSHLPPSMRIPPGPLHRTFVVWLLLLAVVALAVPRTFAQAPAHDAFANRSTLTGVSASVVASNLNATAETGEPAHAGNPAAKSVWWQWTAPQSGRVNVDTFGSAIDTVLAVYRGTTLGNLTNIAFNDEAGGTHASALAFYATAGTTFSIAVDGYQGASGNIALRFVSTQSADLYSTNFDSFTVGGDTIIGTDGWSSTNFGSGASGIIQSEAFGSRAAYVGFNSTTDALVSVWRPIGAVPEAGLIPNVQFSVDLAVMDSTVANGKRDAFFLILSNASGQLLAAINFDNASQRIYRFDGTTYRDVGAFVRGTRYTLTAAMNFAAGRWSATLGGTTLFTNQPINAQSRALSLGFVSASWLIATAGAPGDNYLLFDNYRVTISVLPVAPMIVIQPVNRWVLHGKGASFTVEATGTPVASYRWEVSTDGGMNWNVIGNDPSYSGQLSGTLTVPTVLIGANNYRYRCVVGNGVGPDLTSGEATLTVSPSDGVTAIAAGSAHTLLVRIDGTLWSTGNNTSGQLGDGTTVSRTIPIPVTSSVVAVAAGSAHSLFLKTDGTLWGMGDNSQGQLGDGATLRRTVPWQIAANVAAMAAGSNHTLFLKTDGTLWVAGRNDFGQLGDGTTVNRTAPFQVAEGVMGVCGGGFHSLFFKADRTLWAMGLNSAGQLGDGTTTNRSSPVQVARQVVTVAAGNSHSLFIKVDGTLWAMGQNSAGALGDGTTTNRISPVQIASSVSSVAGGNNHTLFVDPTSPVLVVGSNSDGQLGLSVSSALSPVRLVLDGVAVAAGLNYSLFIGSDGSVHAMGNNSSGQLGNGGTTNLGNYEIVVGGVAGPVPAVPTAISTDDQWPLGVRVSWNPAVRSMRYEVWRNTTNSTATATRIASGLTACVFFDPDEIAGTTYFYWIKAVNLAGSSGFSAESAGVTIIARPPQITSHPASQAVNAGTSVTLGVEIVSNAPVSYQWRKGGALIAGATKATLTLSPLQLGDAGSFDVAVTNVAGSATSNVAVLIVNDAARITVPQLSQTAAAGSAVALTVAVAGAPPLSFTWKRNGQVIAGATDATLSRPSVTLSDRGFYEMTVTNVFGSSWTTFRLDVGPANGAVVGWGNNQFGQTIIPSMPNDVVALAAGGWHTLALRSNGAAVGWGLPLAAAVPDGLGRIVAISAGGSHSLALAASGAVVAWGSNLSGQATVPAGLNNIIAIAAGYEHSLALRNDGTVVAWGANSDGQCNVPVSLSRVVAIAAPVGNRFSLALKSDGSVVAWGGIYNSLTVVPADMGIVREIAAGGPSLALRSDGILVAWGPGGTGFFVDSQYSDRLPGVTTMSAGASHGLVIKTDESVFAFGYGGAGETLVPPGLTNATAVAAGWSFSLALISVNAAPGNLVAPSSRASPAGAVSLFSVSAEGFGLSYRWQRLAAGRSVWADLNENQTYSGVATATLAVNAVTLAMTGDQFRCDISNSRGGLTTSPATLTVNLATVAAVSGGDAYALVLQSDGALWATGANWTGQFGDGTRVSRQALTYVAGSVGSISAASGFSLFRKLDGSTWAMGNNEFGQLGDGTTTLRSTPVLISTDAIAVIGGLSHTLLVKSDATLWAVGLNTEGQLGDGTTTNRLTPVQVATGVAKIAAGHGHSVFLKNDGTMWAMGANDYGQLGDGTFLRRTSPVQVATNVTAISTYANHTLFIRADGTLFGTGINVNGQLGDGSTTNRNVPVQLSTGVASASTGYYHSLFVTTEGSLWGSGWSLGGALGDGSNEQRLSPVQIASRVAFTSCGGVQSYFVKTDGSLWAMGVNNYGQLGDGTLVNRTIPVRITASVAPATTPSAVAASDGAFTDKVRVSWAPVVSAVRYELWRNTSTTTVTATRLADDLSVSPYDDLNTVADTPYYYWVKAGNDGGTSSFSAVDTGFRGQPVAPTLTTPPLAQVVGAGATITLSVVVTGTPAPSYQWRRNNSDIAGATNATFTRTNAQLADAGNYTVFIVNSAGSATSAPVTVSVIPPGTIAQHKIVLRGYTAGGTVAIRSTLTYSGTATTAGWSVLLPTGWSFASSTGDTGATKPAVGATNLLDWSWATPPASPITFAYTLNVPPGAAGTYALTASVALVQSDTTIPLLGQPDPLMVSAAATRHTVDSDGDGRINLFELTRMIELYNVRNGTVRTGAYKLDATTEDGFDRDPARSGTAAFVPYHSADTNRDALLALVELTRVIELYNTRAGTTRTGAYRVQAGSEDGFAPGP